MTSKTCMQLRVQDLLKKKKGGDQGVFSNKKRGFFCKTGLAW